MEALTESVVPKWMTERIARRERPGKQADRPKHDRLIDRGLLDKAKIVDEARATMVHYYTTFITSVSASVWETAKVRLAQLMPAHELNALLNYYAELEATRIFILALTDKNVRTFYKLHRTDEDFSDVLDKLLQKGEQAKAVTDSFIGQHSIDKAT